MSRLPRRYDRTMATLAGLSESKNEKIRLQAALRMSEILLAHQASEERIAIATERAAARRAEAEASASKPEVVETPEQAADRLIRAVQRTGANHE